jgi:hypothetical protein
VSEPPRNPAGDSDLEELGDEVIISQETGAHAPQPRANVTTDHPTVVISEPPPERQSGGLPAYRAPRERTEQTVVIRDRKRLDRMRREMMEMQARQRGSPRGSRSTVYLIGFAALASLVTGTLIAALVDASDGPAPTPAASTLQVVPAPEPEGEPSAVPPGAIDLDALPEESHAPRKQRSDSVPAR